MRSVIKYLKETHLDKPELGASNRFWPSCLIKLVAVSTALQLLGISADVIIV